VPAPAVPVAAVGGRRRARGGRPRLRAVRCRALGAGRRERRRRPRRARDGRRAHRRRNRRSCPRLRRGHRGSREPARVTNARPMIITGVLLLASASALASTIQAPWHLYLYTGVLGALGLVALGWVPMGLLLSRWFQARRGRMAGVAFSGMGFGVFVIGPVTQW